MPPQGRFVAGMGYRAFLRVVCMFGRVQRACSVLGYWPQCEHFGVPGRGARVSVAWQRMRRAGLAYTGRTNSELARIRARSDFAAP